MFAYSNNYMSRSRYLHFAGVLWRMGLGQSHWFPSTGIPTLALLLSVLSFPFPSPPFLYFPACVSLLFPFLQGSYASWASRGSFRFFSRSIRLQVPKQLSVCVAVPEKLGYLIPKAAIPTMPQRTIKYSVHYHLQLPSSVRCRIIPNTVLKF